jgi:hypothetical protein
MLAAHSGRCFGWSRFQDPNDRIDRRERKIEGGLIVALVLIGIGKVNGIGCCRNRRQIARQALDRCQSHVRIGREFTVITEFVDAHPILVRKDHRLRRGRGQALRHSAHDVDAHRHTVVFCDAIVVVQIIRAVRVLLVTAKSAAALRQIGRQILHPGDVGRSRRQRNRSPLVVRKPSTGFGGDF